MQPVDKAEDSLLRSLEERRATSGKSTDSNAWTPSVPGEQPPLAPVVPDTLNDSQASRISRSTGSKKGDAKSRLLWLRQNLHHIKAKDHWDVVVPANAKLTESNVLETVAENAEVDAPPISTEQVPEEEENEGIFEGVGGDNPEAGVSHVAVADSDMDRLISGAAVVDELFADDDSSVATSYSDYDSTADGESLPLTKSGLENKMKRKKRRMSRRMRKCCKRTFKTPVWSALSPSVVVPKLLAFFTGIFLLGIVPLLAAAAILFYQFNNPTPDFIEGSNASLSYWLVFIARQLTTRALGRLSAYVLVHVLAMRSKWAVKLFGPHLTLLIINAEGWPLTATAWALWDLFILHGNNTFQQNWLFFAGIEMFSPANPGGEVLMHVNYLRAIIALLVAGLATALKRTLVALLFGKKSFRRFKPGLQTLLIDVLIVTEVAALSSELEDAFDLDEEEEADEVKSQASRPPMKTRWTSIKFQSDKGLDGKKSVAFDEGDDDDSNDSGDQSDEGVKAFSRREMFQGSSYSDSSGVIGIQALLDKWEEPVNKLDREVDPSISDMLQFRKALAFMDGRFPFSRSFGPANTRGECVSSAQDTYQRLMFISPKATNLSFDVLAVLALDQNGIQDRKKYNQLKRIFRPDRSNELNELAFVQSCDSVYRKLRYFRASVGNASVIDNVLEGALEKAFYFLLIIVICIIMKYNPWTLLVSLSTLIVSMSFALGAATSKYIEGILLIAARKPYDIGERIMIVGSENTAKTGTQFSWFVEDVNLYSTTLRFAATNEVATVTNGSIAASRIVNCARSPKALITLTAKYTLYMTDEQSSALKEALAKYIKDLPRTWVQIIYFEISDLDPDWEYVEYTILVQHRKTWQDAMGIGRDKAQLVKFMYEAASKLNIHYDTPIRRMRIFRPGETDGLSDASTPGTSMADAMKAAGLEMTSK